MGVHTEAELLAKMEADKELEPPAPDPNKPGGRGRRSEVRTAASWPTPKPGEEPKPDDAQTGEPTQRQPSARPGTQAAEKP